MTVATIVSKSGPYAGAGTVGPFFVGFRFLENAHLQVVRTAVSGAETVLVLDSDYTVSGAGAASGQVTLAAALPSGETLTIVRDVPFTQDADYVANDAFPAESHERGLDKLTMLGQQNAEAISRTLKLPVSVQPGVSTTLPNPTANQIIAWNENGSGLQNLNPVAMATIVAFGTSKADVFTGDGVKNTFLLTASPGALANLDVAVNGFTQIPGVDYIWTSGTAVTFANAPANNAKILVRYFQALPQGITDSAAALFLQSGNGAVSRDIQDKGREIVSVYDFMTAAQRMDVRAGTLLIDCSGAVQAAIDYVSPVQGSATRAGTVIADLRYPMLIRTPIDATNSRQAGTKVRDGLRLLGFNLVGETGAGKCVLETTGSQWLEFEGIIASGATSKSTVGILQAISSILPQTQNQKIHARIFMHDDVSANGSAGTVGIWNFGAEENTYDRCYIQANLPAFITAYKVSPNYTSVIPPSYQTLMASHSCGVNTWTGETFLLALGRHRPSLVTEDVNSLVFTNVYMANQGSGGGNLDAWRQYGGFQGGSIQGTIEQHTSIRIVGAVIGANLRFTFGGLVITGQPHIVLNRGGQGQLIDTDIDMQDTEEPGRVLFEAAVAGIGEQISCYVRNVRIRCNSDKLYLALPENVAWNPRTGNVSIEGINNTDRPYRYEIGHNRKFKLELPGKTIYTFGGASGGEVVRFVAPTSGGTGNSLAATIKLSGFASTSAPTTSAVSARYIEASLFVLISASGTISVSGSTVQTGSQSDQNSAGNSITALSVAGIVGAGFVQITLSPSVSGTNQDSVLFVGSAEMVWNGNEARAPRLQLV